MNLNVLNTLVKLGVKNTSEKEHGAAVCCSGAASHVEGGSLHNMQLACCLSSHEEEERGTTTWQLLNLPRGGFPFLSTL